MILDCREEKKQKLVCEIRITSQYRRSKDRGEDSSGGLQRVPCTCTCKCSQKLKGSESYSGAWLGCK